MRGSYNNFAYFSADFFVSREKLENMITELMSPEFSEREHGDIESFIQQEGPDLLRTLLQGYLNIRAANKARHKAVYFNEHELNHVRQTSRKMESIFGLVKVKYPIATGVIEGACRHLINDRLDIAGDRWCLQGAEAILRLRSIYSR